MLRQARTGMDTPAERAAVPYTMHHCQHHPSPARLFVDYADFRWHCYRSRFHSPASSASLLSPFSSSFCVKFTFAHQDLFQQQNLRSTRKSLLRTLTGLYLSLSPSLSPSVYCGIFRQHFDASTPHSCPCPCPCHVSHLIIIMQSILLIIQNCA